MQNSDWPIVVEIASALSPLITAIATVVLAFLTGFYVWYTRKLARESHKQMELMSKQVQLALDEGGPKVVLFFARDPDLRGLIFLVLQNYGRRPAYNVRIESNPPLVPTFTSKENQPPEVVPFLVPGQELRTILARDQEVFQQPSVPLDYDVTVTWLDGLTGKHIIVHQPLTLRDRRAIAWRPSSLQYSLKQIAKELDRIGRTLRGRRRLGGTISGDR